MLAGGTARIWAAVLVSPLELIRTKMQSQKLSYAGNEKVRYIFLYIIKYYCRIIFYFYSCRNKRSIKDTH